jgi:hypothetical protein
MPLLPYRDLSNEYDFKLPPIESTVEGCDRAFFRMKHPEYTEKNPKEGWVTIGSKEYRLIHGYTVCTDREKQTLLSIGYTQGKQVTRDYYKNWRTKTHESDTYL